MSSDWGNKFSFIKRLPFRNIFSCMHFCNLHIFALKWRRLSENVDLQKLCPPQIIFHHVPAQIPDEGIWIMCPLKNLLESTELTVAESRPVSPSFLLVIILAHRI